MSFKDHFSKQAADYAKFRPSYPREMFEYLGTITATRQLAWDCATGNGQAAVELATAFDRDRDGCKREADRKCPAARAR